MDLEEMRLITRRERHSDRVLGDTAGGAFAGCVNRLGNLRPMGEVAADDHVVTEVRGTVGRLAGLGNCRFRLSVNGSWIRR